MEHLLTLIRRDRYIKNEKVENKLFFEVNSSRELLTGILFFGALISGAFFIFLVRDGHLIWNQITAIAAYTIGMTALLSGILLLTTHDYYYADLDSCLIVHVKNCLGIKSEDTFCTFNRIEAVSTVSTYVKYKSGEVSWRHKPVLITQDNRILFRPYHHYSFHEAKVDAEKMAETMEIPFACGQADAIPVLVNKGSSDQKIEFRKTGVLSNILLS